MTRSLAPAESNPAPVIVEDPDTEFLEVRADLLRLALGMTRSREDAEDAVQEVWLRWQRHRNSVVTPPHWLHAVTRNVVIDQLRDRRTDRETTQRVAIGAELVAWPATPVVEATVELRPAIRAVLSSLSSLERAVFVLHDGLDWSYADVARLLNRSEAAVRQLRHRAQHHLASGVARFHAEPESVDAVAAAYLQVSTGSEVLDLLDMLAPRLAARTPIFWCQNRKIVHDVAAIVLFREDRLLLCHRRKQLAWFPAGWDLPGSHRRHGEPAIACAVRAARQELDISVTEPHQLVEQCEDDFRLTLFEAAHWAGEPRNRATSQHDEIGLFTRDQASGLHLVDRRLLMLFDQAAA